MRILAIILGISLLSLSNTTIETSSISMIGRIPRVFIMDENENIIEELSTKYDKALIEVCKNDLEKAYGKWNNTLIAMEKYANQWNYNIKGVKIWVKVFCNKKGYIDYIAYSLNPNSRNIDTELFTKFLTRFIRIYRLDVRSSRRFYHYGRASFPVQ